MVNDSRFVLFIYREHSLLASLFVVFVLHMLTRTYVMTLSALFCYTISAITYNRRAGKYCYHNDWHTFLKGVQ